jgi:hypothetical protein
MCSSIRVCAKILKEGQNCGFDPSLRKLSIKSSLAHHASERILKVASFKSMTPLFVYDNSSIEKTWVNFS